MQVSRVAELFTDPSFAKPFVGLLAASQHDEALAGALYYRLLVSHEPLSPEYGQRVVAELFTGLQSPRNSLSTGASTSAGTT